MTESPAHSEVSRTKSKKLFRRMGAALLGIGLALSTARERTAIAPPPSVETHTVQEFTYPTKEPLPTTAPVAETETKTSLEAGPKTPEYQDGFHLTNAVRQLIQERMVVDPVSNQAQSRDVELIDRELQTLFDRANLPPEIMQLVGALNPDGTLDLSKINHATLNADIIANHIDSFNLTIISEPRQYRHQTFTFSFHEAVRRYDMFFNSNWSMTSSEQIDYPEGVDGPFNFRAYLNFQIVGYAPTPEQAHTSLTRISITSYPLERDQLPEEVALDISQVGVLSIIRNSFPELPFVVNKSAGTVDISIPAGSGSFPLLNSSSFSRGVFAALEDNPPRPV